jgi:hypothetical protein
MSAKVKYVGRQYLTLQGCGKKEEALKVMKKISQALETLYEKELIRAYLVRSLHNKDQILDEALEPDEILFFSDGHLPIVFCNLTFDIAELESSQTALDAFETEFGLKLFRSFNI